MAGYCPRLAPSGRSHFFDYQRAVHKRRVQEPALSNTLRRNQAPYRSMLAGHANARISPPVAAVKVSKHVYAFHAVQRLPLHCVLDLGGKIRVHGAVFDNCRLDWSISHTFLSTNFWRVIADQCTRSSRAIGFELSFLPSTGVETNKIGVVFDAGDERTRELMFAYLTLLEMNLDMM